MEPSNDMDLLRDYAARASEVSFKILVDRHVHRVYSAALRQAEDPRLAEEITQTVFIILARKAGNLSKHTMLSGWLFKTTHFVAAAQRRAASRRRRHELNAHMESLIQAEAAPSREWQQIAPLLDEAMARLSETDRNAVLLRYFDNKSLTEVGAALGTSQDTASKRVARAVNRLRAFFAKRGAVLPAVAIGGLLSAHAVHAAPASLALSVIGATALKSTATTASAAAMLQETLKALAWLKLKQAALVTAGMLFLVGIASLGVRTAWQPADPAVRERVRQLVAVYQHNSFDSPEIQELASLGPKILPYLAELIRWRDHAWNRQYQKAWPFLPGLLQHYLPDPRATAEVRRNALEIVDSLGPAAARPLTGAICRSLDSPDFKADEYDRRCLYWSIPESPKAVSALTRFLAKPDQAYGLFGWTSADELWPKLPQTAPLLIPWLSNLYGAGEAAEALGRMGTNALAAVPALIQVGDRGVAGTPLKLAGRITYSSPEEPYIRNRRAALVALGKIGLVSPVVSAAFRRALEDEAVRTAALTGLITLERPTNMTVLLSQFALPKSRGTQQFIHALGDLGTPGQAALPWLRQFTAAPFVEQMPEVVDPQILERPLPSAEWDHLRLEAILAICRIDPGEIRHHIPDLVAQLSWNWDAKDVLASARSLTSEVMAGLDPWFKAPEIWRRLAAAEIALALEPKHEAALALLRQTAGKGQLSDRIRAAHLLWKQAGEAHGLIPLLIEGLQSREDFADQLAAQLLADPGLPARPALPALQRALWHPSCGVRYAAGQALRQIAPEALPAIQ